MEGDTQLKLSKIERRIKMNIEKLLVIEPHPDDFILMCGGLAKKLRNNGKEVYVVTFTNGGAVRVDAGNQRLIRSKESKKADEILGTTHREILDFETRASWDKGSEIYDELFKRIRRIRPDTIITTHYDKVHPDHMFIATFVEPLAYQVEEKIRLDFGESVKPRLLLGENPRKQLANPNVYADITDTYQAKEEALRTQESQLEILGPRIFQDMRALAASRAIGMDMGVDYCEAFEEIPIHYKTII